MTEPSQSYLLPTIAAKPPTRKGSHIRIERSLFRVAAENAVTKAAIADGFIVCDARTLKDPKIHPGDHRDLMLPVADYSTYSVQLTPGLQDEAIARTDHMLYES